MNMQTITNVSDCVPLYLPHSLYLKPLAKFYISVSLPANKLGKTISNNDIMEKLTNAVKPDNFLVLKVSKSTLEFIRFEAEIEDRSKLKNVLARLDGRPIRLSEFNDPFKIRACEARNEFPTRYDWDSFFRDAKNMDEMKPGERPDTIHISNLPIRWFCPRHMENDDDVKPSENIFKRIFEKFGSIRCVDIPICDLYRPQMKTEINGMKTFNFDQEIMFEGYVQFSEYVGFVKAMDEFRGMKLVKKCGDKNQAVNIYVTFDKTKHLSDASIKRRNIVRDRLIAKERAKQEEEARKKKEEQERLERERKKQEELKQKELQQQREREERRKEKHLRKLREKGQLEITNKIRIEERKLLIAQRKLEGIRMLEALFERMKLKESQLKKDKNDNENVEKNKASNKALSANDLRNKLVDKYKAAHIEILNKQKTKLEQVKGKTGLLALLEGSKKKDSSPSVNSISSDDSLLSDSHQSNNEKKKKLKKKKKHGSSLKTDSSSDNDKNKSTNYPLNPFNVMYNPEMAADWLPLGIHPYAPTVFPGMPPIRPGFFPNSLPVRGFPYRGRFPRGRGRGGRGRAYCSYIPPTLSYPYDSEQYYKYFKKMAGNHDYDYEDEHDHRRSNSYSRYRSRLRSRSRRRSRSRSRSRRSWSRHSRSRSRSKSRDHNSSRSRSRSRSHSKSRKHSRSRSKSRTKQKLVSTRRSRSSSSTTSSSDWSKSRSRSRSLSWSRNTSSREKIALQPNKLVRSAKEIQRSVLQKLHDRLQEEFHQGKESLNTEASTSKRRSMSVDSSKFKSPKRKEKSSTPDNGFN